MCGASCGRSLAPHMLFMVDRTKYIERLKKLYELKNKTTLPDELALEYFEKLICLVGTITSHVKARGVIVPKEL